jgi:hypothetical protein
MQAGTLKKLLIVDNHDPLVGCLKKRIVGFSKPNCPTKN